MTTSSRLLDSRADRDFRSLRDLAIIRLFVDTGMRLEGMSRLRYDAADADLSDVDLRGARWCRRSARRPRGT
jgi:hypothetical protein